MANVKKIKLPNNTTVDIIDSRISGVDTTVTSESTNVVTSGAVATAISNAQSAAENAKSVTYNDLKTAKTGGTLVPGTWYRITDYVATTIDAESRSANHPFDIIVMAESANTLSEEGFAALHSGDSYFANSKLEAWKVWYNIDNDTTRFAWADSTNGKGVIYRLIDEFQNDLPFDFKGIQFKRYAVTAQSTYTASLGQLDGLCIGCGVAPKGFTINSNTYDWYYTFSLVGNSLSGTKTDASLTKKAHDVTFAYYVQRNTLLNNVFIDGDAVETLHTQLGLTLSDADYDVVAANCTFSDATYNLTVIGDICNSSANETQVRNNLFVGSFRHNVFKTDSQENTIVGDYIFNTAQLYDNVIFVTNGMARNNVEALWSNYIYVNGDIYYNRGTRICNNTIVITASTSNAIFGNNFGVQFEYNTISAQFSYNSCQYNNTYNTINAKVIGCTFNTLQFGHNTVNTPVVSSVFAGPVEYADIPQVSNKYFAFAHVGALRGSSSSHIKLGYSDFFTASVSDIVNQWTFTTNDDGQVVATRKTDDGVDTGVYASSAESVSGTWHTISSGGGGGTVTSVAMTVPTGLSVSGSPITTSGTLAVSLASGYSIPTTTKQSEWDGKADKVSSATNGDFAGLDSNGNLTDSGKKDSDFVHTSGNETIAGNKSFSGTIYVNGGLTTDDDTNFDPAKYEWIYNYYGDSLQEALDAKQATLVSGTNIKTINNESILGSGNITIQGGGSGDAKVYAFNFSSWDYDIVDGHLNIPLATYEAMVDDVESGIAVVLRLQCYTTSSGVIQYGTAYDFYLSYHYQSSPTWSYLFFVRFADAEQLINIYRSGNNTSLVYSDLLLENRDNRAPEVVNVGTYYSNNFYPTVKAVADYVDHVYVLQYSSWSEVESGLTVSSTMYSQMADDARRKRNVVLRLANYTTSGGQVTYGDYLDFYLTAYYQNGAETNSTLYFNSIMTGSGLWVREVTINRSGNNIRFNYRTQEPELVGNKTQSISGSGTTYSYPTTKAVVDYVSPKVLPSVTSSDNDKILKVVNGAWAAATGGGGSTTDCVHKTGDETVGGDKTFTDNIGVVDADHIVYSGGGGGGGFTRGYAVNDQGNPSQTMTFTGLLGEPKAFIIAYGVAGDMDSNGVNFVAGDSTGLHGVYNTGTQHNYSASFTKSYSSGTLTITAPSGVVFGDYAYSLVYYYGDGTLTFKTSTIQPGSGVTAVTFTGTDLTEVPAMYAVMLETQVNDEQYRRVAGYTNSAYSGSAVAPEGITFLTGGPTDTTSSFTASYNNGLYINSGGMNAGGYFHNPGTYVLYYLMASDVAGGGSGSYQSLGDELDDIRDTIGDIATILASI